jgi:hypothetical protein
LAESETGDHLAFSNPAAAELDLCV